jgi:hypothetical protein
VITSRQKWGNRIRFLLVFLILTIWIHSMLGWFHQWLKPADPYRKPEGRAAKVFRSGYGDEAEISPGDRLRLFYWYGE